jgi:hypothetical protein
MTRGHRFVTSVLWAVALFSPVIFGGCAVRSSYRVYDPYYEDYHVWNHNEVAYYQRWEVETHALGTTPQANYSMKIRQSSSSRIYL